MAVVTMTQYGALPAVRITAADEDSGAAAANETTATLNTNAQQNEYVARAITAWNLTDEDDRPIPLGTVDPDRGPDQVRYAAVRRLPSEVFDQVLGGIEGVSRRKKEAKALEAADSRFQAAGQQGADAGAAEGTGARGAGQLPGGAPVLAAARGER